MPVAEAKITESRNTHCPLCDAPLDASNPTECPRCDWVLGYRRQHDHMERFGAGSGRDSAAMFMSVIPGLGHLYKGHLLLGALMVAGALVVGLFIAATVSATVGASLLLLPVYWAGVMLHAYWADDLALAKLGARVHSPS